MKHPKTFTAIWTLVIAAALVIVVGLIVMYSGVYNVAAIGSHSAISEWVLDTTMTNSVEHQARSVVVPADFEKMTLDEGSEHYHEMCVGCHGAPGVKQSEISEGLHPRPPHLQKTASDWTPAEIYWIIKNGIDMTAMPGFGATHSEEKLWAITAFVHRLPKMTAEQYKSLAPSGAEAEDGDHGGDEHQHGGGSQ